MTRGWKIAIGIVAAVIALDLMLVGLRDVTGGTPGGPTSSSYATGADGAAAYAALLARAGHRVLRARTTPAHTTLSPSDTAVVLDPPFVVDKDAAALSAFVSGGGRLVVAAEGQRWVQSIPRGGSGNVVVVDDSSTLQNAHLAQGDNAAVALRAAGPAARRVVFFETYHGYGQASGLSAIPANWADALLVGALATLVFMIARIRRFGPPEAEARELAPPRAAYVDALAATLVKTGDRDLALGSLRDEVRRRIDASAGLRADADDRAFAEAAARLGLQPDEVTALSGTNDELALGRALARTASRADVWMS
jgi:uncharacterized protein DUF4350